MKTQCLWSLCPFYVRVVCKWRLHVMTMVTGARHNFVVACRNFFAAIPRGKFSREYDSFGKLYEN